MKKVFGLIVALAAVMIFSSCKTIDMSTNQVGWSNYTSLATKDYEVVGIIHMQAKETITTSFLSIQTTKKGQRITYSALMKKAEEMGADDVINVRVDRNTESSSTIFDWLFGSKKVYTYYATATAIKFKGTVQGYNCDGNEDILEKKPTKPTLNTLINPEEY